MGKSLDITGISRQRALANLIDSKYKNINDFCKQTGEDYARIYRYVHKDVKIGDKVLAKFAEIFKVSPAYFDTYKPNIETFNIPIIGLEIKGKKSIQQLMTESQEFTMLEDRVIKYHGWKKEDIFALIANDNSMDPPIKDQSEVIVDSSQTQIENNKSYAIKINSIVYIRKLMKSATSGIISLVPENKVEFPIEKLNDQTKFIILGKVVYLKLAL